MIQNGTITADHDTEGMVLGCLILEGGTMERANAVLIHAGLFAHRPNFLVYQAIESLHNDGIPVDILTVKNRMKTNNTLKEAGGVPYLMELNRHVVSSSNMEHWITHLKEVFISRELRRVYHAAVIKLDEHSDPLEVAFDTEKKEYEIIHKNIPRKTRPMPDIILDAIEIFDRAKTSGVLRGIPTGLKDLDTETSGWIEPDLTILAGRPAMGKTALALQLGLNAGAAGYKPGFIELEMSDIQLVNRAAANLADLSAEGITTGNVPDRDFPKVLKAFGMVQDSGLEISDLGTADFQAVKTECIRLLKLGCKILFIDYLGLITHDSRNANKSIGEICRRIKMEICKDLNVPVILLHQLSRSVETRGGDKRPILSDLRDSGEIEQDADRVLFVYRPAYYGYDTDENGDSTLNLMEIIIRKNRTTGKLGTVKVESLYESGRIQDWNVNVLPDNKAPF